MEDIGLMFYNARWPRSLRPRAAKRREGYDPELGRFAQADTIVPGAGNPAAYDRYAYVLNNPIKFNDPSGHDVGNPGKDEFTYVKSPNGFEQLYKPSLWNDNGKIQLSTNCYAYALDIRTGFQDGDKLQPGQFNGTDLTEITVQSVNTAAKNDATASERTFESVLPDKSCPSDTYEIALIIDPLDDENDLITDYHWLRLNPDGTWSHKPGHQPVTNVDASGNIIENPMIANFDYSSASGLPLNYSVFGGFYCVGPAKETSATDYSFR